MNTSEPLKRALHRKWERGESWMIIVPARTRHRLKETHIIMDCFTPGDFGDSRKKTTPDLIQGGGRCVCVRWGGDGDDNNECVRRWLHHSGHQGDKRSEPRVARLRIEDESHLHHYGRHPIRAMPVTTCISRWQTFLHSGRQNLLDLTVCFNTLIKWTGLGEELVV